MLTASLFEKPVFAVPALFSRLITAISHSKLLVDVHPRSFSLFSTVIDLAHVYQGVPRTLEKSELIT